VRSRAAFAEALGTAALLYVVVGSGIAVDRLGGDPAGGLFFHAAAVGLGLAALIAGMADVSGAHFNPAVTLAFWRRGDVKGRTAGGYVVAQIVGGLAGVAAAHLAFDTAIVSIATSGRGGFGRLVSEAIGTFWLVLIIIRLTDLRPAWVPAAVGGWVATMVFSTASTGFLNPAVTLARMLTDTYSGIAPSHTMGFIAAQAGGSYLAVAVAGRFRAEGSLEGA
jgi:glycerol uptake facilitator-like aquaporin